MAKYTSVYRRERSPFWWVAYLDPLTGKRRAKATPFRIDTPMGRRKAQDEANELSREAKAFVSSNSAEIWDNWVESFLRSHHKNSVRTCERTLGSWSQWRLFLQLNKISVPRGLTYQHVADFMSWRMAQRKHDKTTISVNTALCDVKCFSTVMKEAMKRGWCSQNPCAKTGIKKDPPREKPEITPEQEKLIRESLPTFVAQDPELHGYMVNCFEIGIHQGCRLRETEIPLSRIDTNRMTVTFQAKGDRKFATKLHPALLPMLSDLRASGAKVTCNVPRLSPIHWRDFFDGIGMPDHSFHCTRVTVVTRLARAGVPISQAMSFVGHSSELVHRIYTRLQPGDLGACIAALS